MCVYVYVYSWVMYTFVGIYYMLYLKIIINQIIEYSVHPGT